MTDGRARDRSDLSVGHPSELANAEPFLRELHDALAHLRDLAVRADHPLSKLLGQLEPPAPPALRRLLLEAIDRLQPPPHVADNAPRWRRYRYLQLRYVEGATLGQVSAALGIGERQARREHQAALRELAATLLESTVPSSADASAEPGILADASASPASPPRDQLATGDLETELSPLETEPELEAIDLGSALADGIRLVERLARERSVSIDDLPDIGPVVVIAMRTVLRQILLNVLGYLMQLDSVQRIAIQVSPRETSVELRFNAVGARNPPGAGQRPIPPALAAARRLAEGQEGLLRVESDPTRGTVVRLTLLTTRAILALVVDDNPDIVRLFRRFLRGAGFRLVQARNGIRAHQLARTLHPDLIILDLMMPVQDGWDLFHALRGDQATARIPIITCSVLPERELALSLGADDFLAKPVTPESLLAALASFRQPRRSDSPPAAESETHRDSP